VRAPSEFDEEYEHSPVKGLHGSNPVRFVSLGTLLAMKRDAGRPQDLLDIDQLTLRNGEAPGE
jgi:hypothetical protein